MSVFERRKTYYVLYLCGNGKRGISRRYVTVAINNINTLRLWKYLIEFFQLLLFFSSGDFGRMALCRHYLLLMCLVTSFYPSLSKTKVIVGLLAPFTGSWNRAPRFASAVSIAVDYINKNTTLLPYHTLDFVFHDTVCSESGGIAAAVNLMRHNVSVFIGPACSKACIHSGFVAAAYSIPMVSYGCSTTTLSNTALYPNFFRTKPFARGSKGPTSLALAAVMNNFNWRHCCLAEDIDTVFTPLTKEIASLFVKRNIIIDRIERFYGDNYNEMEIMRKLKPHCRSKLAWNAFCSTSDWLPQAKPLNKTKGKLTFPFSF